MLELDNISLGYGRKVLLEAVSACFGAGECVALLGRNGAGKSTLMRAVCGLERLRSGRICIDGRDISKLSREEAARMVSFVGTEKPRIPDLRCRSVVALGRAPYTDWLGNADEEDNKMIDKALTLVGMTDYAERTMDSLSDGECQRIMIARALAQDTPVMLLDEPTAFLDLPGKYAVASLLAKLAHSAGKTIVFSTHDLDIALENADGIALLDTPGLIHGSCTDILRSGAIGRVFGIGRMDEKSNLSESVFNTLPCRARGVCPFP